MRLRPPTPDEMKALADSLHFTMAADELEAYRTLVVENLAADAAVDAMVEPKPDVKYPRTPGRRPEPGENPHNAWYVLTDIRGKDAGLLAGKRVALKDTICVAGDPMGAGTAVMDGFVPDIDATVVTRILDAGGIIAGKATTEGFSFGGAGHNSATGPVRNPRDPSRSSGGSSNGSAALIAAREVDMAIGGDQGGSVRLPASWCGVYGMKPTRGVIPYTGAIPMDPTLDHLGPMANSTREVALLLEAVAGPDGLDPRQAEFTPEAYSAALTGTVEGLRIGILEEGFAYEGISQPDVDQAVHEAAQHFATLGAEVESVSVPAHRDGQAILVALAIEGAYATLVLGNGMGHGWPGFYNSHLLEYFSRAMPRRANDLSPSAKSFLFLGGHIHNNYHGKYYAKAQNLRQGVAAPRVRAGGRHALRDRNQHEDPRHGRGDVQHRMGQEAVPGGSGGHHHRVPRRRFLPVVVPSQGRHRGARMGEPGGQRLAGRGAGRARSRKADHSLSQHRRCGAR